MFLEKNPDTDTYDVLLIEDDDNLGKDVKDYLDKIKEVKFNTIWTKSIKDLINKKEALEKEFDIIIVDMFLPESEEGGLCVIEHFHNLYPLTFIIVYTAYPNIENCVKAMQLGANDYVCKLESKSTREFKDHLINQIRSLNKHYLWEKDLCIGYFPEKNEELVENFGNKYIAVLKDKRILSADTRLELLIQLKENNIRDYFYIVQPIKK